jgi:putative oxidoreductase
VFAITDAGPGRLSLDAASGRVRRGPGWALAQLAAGALGSACAVAIGARQGAPQEPAPAGAQREGEGEAQEHLHEEVQAAAAGDGRAAPVGASAS